MVTPAAADHFRIRTRARVSANTPFSVTVTALDPYGNIDTNYAGTITFTTTDLDPNVVLPAAYAFTAGDGGVHTFRGAFILVTPGDQLITATDTAGGISGSASVTVRPAVTPVTFAGRGSGYGAPGKESSPKVPAGRGKSPMAANQALVLAEALDCFFGGLEERGWEGWMLAERTASRPGLTPWARW